MALGRTQTAEFETTRRLFAYLVNESLVRTTIVHEAESENEIANWMELLSVKETQATARRPRIRVARSSDATLSRTGKPPSTLSFLQPEDLAPPVIIEYRTSIDDEGSSKEVKEFHPAVLFDVIAT
ncbi:MAG: hypothetical protein Q9187_007816 [Circinaria calcarea]